MKKFYLLLLLSVWSTQGFGAGAAPADPEPGQCGYVVGQGVGRALPVFAPVAIKIPSCTSSEPEHAAMCSQKAASRGVHPQPRGLEADSPFDQFCKNIQINPEKFTEEQEDDKRKLRKIFTKTNILGTLALETLVQSTQEIISIATWENEEALLYETIKILDLLYKKPLADQTFCSQSLKVCELAIRKRQPDTPKREIPFFGSAYQFEAAGILLNIDNIHDRNIKLTKIIQELTASKRDPISVIHTIGESGAESFPDTPDDLSSFSLHIWGKKYDPSDDDDDIAAIFKCFDKMEQNEKTELYRAFKCLSPAKPHESSPNIFCQLLKGGQNTRGEWFDKTTSKQRIAHRNFLTSYTLSILNYELQDSMGQIEEILKCIGKCPEKGPIFAEAMMSFTQATCEFNFGRPQGTNPATLEKKGIIRTLIGFDFVWDPLKTPGHVKRIVDKINAKENPALIVQWLRNP
ncbi:MAG: hypothetical protein WCG05_04610 [Alphaproteobacteria bacterium]